MLVRDPQSPTLYKRDKGEVLSLDQVKTLAKVENVWIFYTEAGGATRYQRFGKPGTIG